MTSILPISQLGDPVLRQKAQPIYPAWDGSIEQLIDDLIETAAHTCGVGIAAPQVAQSYRLLIIASRPTPRYPHAPVMHPTAMINPKIVAHSDEIVKGWEGCLSVPGIRGLVPRYQTIEIEYIGRDGKLERQKLTDFPARVFQHEYDHLEGIVFLDRVESTQELMAEQEYQKRILPSPKLG